MMTSEYMNDDFVRSFWWYGVVKRSLDVMFAVIASIILIVPALIIAILIKMTSKGPVLYWSDRVGCNNELFKMPKFRTMVLGAPVVATHLLHDHDIFVTKVGRTLRKLSLDEFPQIFSILKGDMSFVGPRPALFNQEDLIELRTKNGVHRLIPGLTGWAQINGRDDLPIPVKVTLDHYYLLNRSTLLDMKILFYTFINVACKKGVHH